MGTVPLVLGLQINNPVAQLGSMVPGVARTYDASVTALLTSTAGNAQLTVADVDSGTGKLTNGTAELASAIQVRATNAANPNTAFTPLRGLSNPVTLLSYNTWFTNDPVTIGFRQAISANEPLTAGGYAKTIRFTLSTTTP
jgi:X-X-X-Leu-X-X-Gly heptad repeat protein